MKKTALFCTILLVSGCATYRPIVDLRPGQTAQGYEHDLGQCQRYADQVNPATQAMIGAVAGAGLSALLATVGGRGNYDRGASARTGGVLGATAGGAHGAEAQMNVIKRCMAGRGYSVLQ